MDRSEPSATKASRKKAIIDNIFLLSFSFSLINERFTAKVKNMLFEINGSYLNNSQRAILPINITREAIYNLLIYFALSLV